MALKTYGYYMPSLKKIIYIIGNLTAGDDNKYVSISEISSHIDDGEDLKVTIGRVRSTMKRYYNLLSSKKFDIIPIPTKLHRKTITKWRLNANGKKYLNKFKDSFDPVTDMSVFEQKMVEVI